MLNFIGFRIITNGEKFRIEGSYKPLDTVLQWIVIPCKGGYWGCESFGFNSVGPFAEFSTKEEAIEFIKKEYGNVGYKKLINTWTVC